MNTKKVEYPDGKSAKIVTYHYGHTILKGPRPS